MKETNEKSLTVEELERREAPLAIGSLDPAAGGGATLDQTSTNPKRSGNDPLRQKV